MCWTETGISVAPWKSFGPMRLELRWWVSDSDDEAYINDVLERHEPLPVWARGEAVCRVAIALERMFDLSLPASNEVLAVDFPYEWQIREAQVGGLDAFLKVMETEVKARVAEIVSIDSSKQAIFGHSLGGLAVLHALFVEPGAFRTFVAASPSIWWNSKAVLAGLEKLADAICKGAFTPRVLVTMGSEEQAADPKVAAKLALDFGEYAALVRRSRMVDNARDLTEKLKALCEPGGLEVGDYVIFPDESHAISPWSALGRAVAFAFPQ